MPRKRIYAGAVAGKTKILREIPEAEKREGNYKLWECKCLNCGANFIARGYLLGLDNEGCPQCRKEKIQLNRIETYKEKAKKHIGEVYGSLEILDVTVKHEEWRNSVYATCKCQKCGNTISTLLSRVISGNALQCKKCSEKNLEKGKKIRMASSVDGTNLFDITGQRKKNKNNKSGYTGIVLERNGKYRAYINFKRRQYHLGTYDTIEEAIQARKEAEKNLWGKFLEEYQETHKEEWDEIQSLTKKGSSETN